MKSLFKVLRVLMATTGVFVSFIGVGQFDYYHLVLNQPIPGNVWTVLNIGIALMLIPLVHVIRTGGEW